MSQENNTAAAAAAPAAAAAAPAADAFADVASTHTLTEAERSALQDQTATADVALQETPTAPTPATAAPAGGQPAAAADAGTSDPAAAPAAAATAPVPPDAADAAAVAAAAAEGAPAAPLLLEVPEAPKDFVAEMKVLDDQRAALDQQYEDGDIDESQHRTSLRELGQKERSLAQEQGRFEAARDMAEAHNKVALEAYQKVLDQDWDAAAKRFATANQEFLANPLRQRAFQDAINLVDSEAPGKLSAQALLDRAAKIAFEAYGWTPKPGQQAPSPGPAPGAAAAALANRLPDLDAVPRTLGDAPAAGSENMISRFSDLDSANTIQLEQAVAGMSAADREKWLMEVDAPIG
jgi:hypothetical protein